MAETAQAVFIWVQNKTDQVVFQPKHDNVWLDIRVVPLYFTALALPLLLLSSLVSHFRKKHQSDERRIIETELAKRRKEAGYVKAMGGWSIVLWNALRVLSCAVFFGATVGLFFVTDHENGERESVPFVVRLATVITAAYTSILSTTLLSPPSQFSSHRAQRSVALTLTLLIVTTVYGLRDLWPYATFDRAPLDIPVPISTGTTPGSSDHASTDALIRVLMWTLIDSVSIAGILVPLCVPRVYDAVDPLDPSPYPAPEQTASILSLTLYNFLDPLIIHPSRQPRIPTFFKPTASPFANSTRSIEDNEKKEQEGHIPLDKLPPLADYDRATVLRSTAFPYMDAFSSGRKRHVFWGVLGYFKWPLVNQAIAISTLGIAEIVGPIAMNRLLAYLETGGVGAVRPWFWIALLFIGPLAVELSLQWYIFIGTRSVVRMESIMTQLVFEHALRIRMKAETSSASSSSSSTTAASGAATIVEVDDIATDPPASEALVVAVGEEQGDLHGGTASEAASTIGTSASHAHAHEETGTETATVVSSSASSVSDGGSKHAAEHKKHQHHHKGKHADKKGAKAKDKKDAKKDKDSDEDDEGKSKNLVGKINNLISTDLSQIQNSKDFLWATLYAPLEIVLDVIFLYILLGWASIVGLIVMIALLPVPAQFTKLFHGLQKSKMKATDDRVQTVTEVMGMLRMVKLFAWESRVEEQIDEKRKTEMVFVWKRRINQTIMNTVNHVIPLVHMIVTYWVYTTIMKQEMTASIVFSSITVFTLIRDQFFNCMYHIPAMIQAKVSFDRINEFLTQTELLDIYTPSAIETRAILSSTASSEHSTEIGFGATHFAWSAGTRDGTLTPSGTRQEYLLRIDEDVVFKKGGFSLIVGPTGSGKTSMLMALLGEMHFVPAGPAAWCNLPREGGVAYAAQESWVQNETIRDNILFGAPYDEVRYKKVIYQCALRRDLELFDAGDRTEVGEKGLTLSGGQKARLTLARAVYSSANILLLDDVLAALDVHTSRWIVEKCFKGDLIRGRTVVFVTHNVALASPIADFVVTLGTDGRVRSAGSVQHALHHDSTFRKELAHEKKLLSKADDGEAIDDEEFDVAAIETGGANKSGKLIVEEEVEIGRMSKKTLLLLAHSMAGRWGIMYWVIFLGCLLINHVLDTGQVWWLGQWANAYESARGIKVDITYYLGIYVLLIVLSVVFFAIAMVQHAVGSVRASIKLHQELIHSVLQTTLRWLDSTPTSRVITRCTQDIDAVDTRVVNALEFALDVTGSILIKLVAVVIFTPIFIIPGAFIGIAGGYLAHLYMKVQLSIKREMSNAKSPVIGHFSAAIAGLVSIRAYGAEEAFKTESMRRIDLYSRAGRSFWNVNRWIGVRINLLSCIFTAALAAYMVYFVGVQNASNVGFSINMAIGFSGMILWWVRIVNDLEVQGNSLERINQYMVIEHEPEAKPEGVPPAYWPASGKLAVEKLCARYSPDGPVILKDVSFNIESGERIGIVGRTGSGKSSLTLSLLRTILTEGEVYLDGLATSKLNLDALRSNITIIPQVPELLSGTLRHNLDPFSQHDDATLNDVLRSSGLSSIQHETDDVRLTLDSPIASGGGNLSVGQKQILALARAMLRQTKILILDEATSAIDYETDALIQKSLRNEFKDVTLITIAHRLQTIMDSDKIMVLDAGQMVEFDRPATLLGNQDGLLYSLVNESSDKDILISMAQDKAASS